MSFSQQQQQKMYGERASVVAYKRSQVRALCCVDDLLLDRSDL